MGALVPYLHYRGREYNSLSRSEWIAIGGGPVVGVLVSQVLPFKRDITEPLGPAHASTSPVIALPWIAPRGQGGGLLLARPF